MTFGKLYLIPGNSRSCAIKAVAKANNIDLEIIETETSEKAPKEYLELNPLGKVPTFVGKDGFVLTECIAIAIYITSQNEKTTLLGKTKQDYALILRWMSYANSELQPSLGAWVSPLRGLGFYNKKLNDEAHANFSKAIAALEKHLLIHTYLVGERITLADFFACGILSRGFQFVLDKQWRSENPNTSRWYETVTKQQIYASTNDVVLADEAIKYTPPKKEPAPKKEATKAAAVVKPKAKEVDEEEDETPAPPKAKHPLEALDKPEMVLDDWKRMYSNSDTRTEALPWFWKHYNPKDYSLWRVDYKYNEELTLTFMSSNLIGGFFTRLEASRKYIFGSASVFGESNNSVIAGAFLIRGQNATHAFDVAPDFESYSFTQLDAKKAEDKEFIDDMWAWDKPLTYQGKTYPHADGKVFK